MKLFDISTIINVKKIKNLKTNKSFTNVTSNSLLIDDKSIFIFDVNSKSKKLYLKEAIRKNAVAILSNKNYRFINIPLFIVEDIEDAKEKLLQKLYPFPPKKSIAITGTNGKTSVLWYISKILNNLKINNKTLGTLGHFSNSKKISEINLTTPAYEELVKYTSSKKNINFNAIIEASSHALDQNRLKNFKVNIAAITNISNDHLDYHKSLINYRNAKLNLFFKHLSKKGIGIVNTRIKYLNYIKNKLKDKKIKTIYFGKNIFYFYLENKKLKFKFFKNSYNINNLKLNSAIELENLECAIACCVALGIDEKLIIKSLKSISNPPGRLQKILTKNKNINIFVDYAHTPDALKKILINSTNKNNKPVVLFGCGGQRDKGKRALMGKVAFKYAKRAYITDDNPRFENPGKIRSQILSGCPNGIEVSNRKSAIKKAISSLKNNEILIVAGKGHEKYQMIKDQYYDFDDYKIIKKYIK